LKEDTDKTQNDNDGLTHELCGTMSGNQGLTINAELPDNKMGRPHTRTPDHTLTEISQVEKDITQALPATLQGLADGFQDPTITSGTTPPIPDLRKSLDCNIDMKDNLNLNPPQIYIWNLAQNIEIEKTLQNYLRLGYIRPSQSSYCSPVLFVKKSDANL
jgi:hypothetical protein